MKRNLFLLAGVILFWFSLHAIYNWIPIINQPQAKDIYMNNKNKKILSIGDNLNTDIKGANLLNYDSLIISNGIHKDEIKEKGIEKVAKSYEAICNYIQSELKW